MRHGRPVGNAGLAATGTAVANFERLADALPGEPDVGA